MPDRNNVGMPVENDISALCIVGDNRSGSTVLQGLFELHPSATTVGELRRLELFLAQGRKCGCGQAVNRCEHWNDVITRAKLHAHEVRTGAPRHKILKRYDEALAFGGTALNASLLTRQFLYRGRKVADHTGRLLSAAALRARAQVVVDNSKEPGHAVYLLHQQKIPVHILFLCRDGRGTVWSKIRRTGISPELATRHWVRTTRSMLALRRVLGSRRSSWIRYEELCSDPRTVVGRVADKVGLGRDGFGAAALATRHDIGGSPSFSGVTFESLRQDLRWRHEMPKTTLAVFESIGGDLNRRLDYA